MRLQLVTAKVGAKPAQDLPLRGRQVTAPNVSLRGRQAVAIPEVWEIASLRSQ